MENKERNWTVPVIFAAIIIIIAIILYGYPRYKVWQQGLEGQAELARAEQNRKIAVQEAEAKKESAKALAEEVISKVIQKTAKMPFAKSCKG